MALRFEWDRKKAEFNLDKHRVSFDEAVTVFADPLARIFDDEAHSETEPREIIVGHSVNQRILLVAFTERPDAVRIFSARRATRRERKDYESEIKS